MPCSRARPERGSTRPACPTGSSTAIPVPTLHLSPGPMWAGSEAYRSRPASPSCARVGTLASALSLATLSSTRRTLGDREVVEAVQLGDRHLGVHKDPVGALDPLQVAGDLVQLGEPRPLGVGDEQLD